jgi:transposase
MATDCGVDFHSKQQTVAYFDTQDGEIKLIELSHQGDEVRRFYERLSKPVRVGLEATGYIPWFEKLLVELGCEVLVGNPTEIRRRARSRQKNDRRDAELILDLMIKNEFPRIHRLSLESLDVLQQLRYRHKLVKMQTMIKNSLHAISLSSGLSLKAKLLTKSGKAKLEGLNLSPALAEQRREWFDLVESIRTRIKRIEAELEKTAAKDPRVGLLRTHPGIGLLTSLALVHTLEPVSRFADSKKVTAFVGLEPCEESSADKVRWTGISKAGPRLLRFLLVEAAQKSLGEDEEMNQFYLQLSQRRGKPKAKVAIARKLLVRAWIMLRDQIDYAEFLRRGIAVRSARTKHRP